MFATARATIPTMTVPYNCTTVCVSARERACVGTRSQPRNGAPDGIYGRDLTADTKFRIAERERFVIKGPHVTNAPSLSSLCMRVCVFVAIQLWTLFTDSPDRAPLKIRLQIS